MLQANSSVKQLAVSLFEGYCETNLYRLAAKVQLYLFVFGDCVWIGPSFVRSANVGSQATGFNCIHSAVVGKQTWAHACPLSCVSFSRDLQ